MHKPMDTESNEEIDRYNPQYPLPEEIQQMPRDDTVCQFCGVSYLIHNEIKSLETKLKECKAEVERLKHIDERELELKEQITSLSAKSLQLNEKLQNAEIRSKENDELILQKDMCISEMKQAIIHHEDELHTFKISNDCLKKQLNNLKDGITKISDMSKVLHLELSDAVDKCKRDMTQFLEFWNTEKTKMLKKLIQFIDVYDRYKDQSKKILDDHTRGVDVWKKKIDTLTSHFIRYKENQEESFEECNKRLMNISKTVIKLKVYFTSVKENVNHDRKALVVSLENYKKENHNLKDERVRMVNSHQHQIQQLRDSFLEKIFQADEIKKELDEKLKENERKYKEEQNTLLKECTTSKNEALSKSEAKCDELYKDKAKLEKEVKTLVEKLKTQRRKDNDDSGIILKQVTASYEKTVAEIEAKYGQLSKEKEANINKMKKLEHQLEAMQAKFHGEMLKLVEHHEKEKKYTDSLFEQKVLDLKKQLDQVKYDNSQFSSNDRELLSKTIRDLQSALYKAEENMKDQIACITENREEIQVLRDCVRRECEERYELTEALAEARSELLSFHRFDNKTNSPKLYNNSKKDPVRSNFDVQKSSRSSHKSITTLSPVSKPRCGPKGSSSEKVSGHEMVPKDRFPKNKINISLKNN